MSKFPSSYKEISFHKQTPFPFCSSAEEGEYDSGRELQLHSNNLSSDNLPQNLNNPTFQVPQLPLSNWDSKISPGKARIAGTQPCILDEITLTILAKNPANNIPSFTKVAKAMNIVLNVADNVLRTRYKQQVYMRRLKTDNQPDISKAVGFLLEKQSEKETDNNEEPICNSIEKARDQGVSK